MDRAAEVISIDDLRRRRAAREAATAARPERPSTMTAWVPVWIAWVPVWRVPAAAQPLQRAAGWGR
jgi:hypothetical protein